MVVESVAWCKILFFSQLSFCLGLRVGILTILSTDFLRSVSVVLDFSKNSILSSLGSVARDSPPMNSALGSCPSHSVHYISPLKSLINEFSDIMKKIFWGDYSSLIKHDIMTTIKASTFLCQT